MQAGLESDVSMYYIMDTKSLKKSLFIQQQNMEELLPFQEELMASVLIFGSVHIIITLSYESWSIQVIDCL